MKLIHEILKDISYSILQGDLNTPVFSLHYDSRNCQPGGLFFCIKGFKTDGHNFMPDALNKDIKAIVIENGKNYYDALSAIKSLNKTITVIATPDTRQAMAIISSNFYDNPQEKLKLIGVTGTNGKTSTTYLIECLLREAGFKTALLGTIQNKIDSEIIKCERTTAESVDLQRIFSLIVQKNCTHVAMEVSSHAIELKRIFGCKYNTGILTNVTHDHLDFHGNFENYLHTKIRFFSEYLNAESSVAILNADDSNFDKICEGVKCKLVTYSVKNKSDIMAYDINCRSDGSQFTLKIQDKKVSFKTPLVGLFNIYNILAAVAYGQHLNLPIDIIVSAVMNCREISGRFQKIDEGQDFCVIVDYAHTPDGLLNILNTARMLCKGRLIVVFGAGGDRDKKKRPIMGQIAARLSDFLVITSDNPRTEEPISIIEDIVVGVEEELEKTKSKNRFKYLVEPDREEAIRKTLMAAKTDDIVIIAGKGHETYQIFRDGTIFFDDRETARKILKTRLSSKTINIHRQNILQTSEYKVYSA